MDIPDKNSNDKLKQILSESRLEMPFTDFEDRLMTRIKKEVQAERYIDRNIRLSWLFFGLGTVFGLLLSVIFSPAASILGFSISKLIIPLYVVGAAILLLFIEQLTTFTLNHKKLHR